MEISIICDTGDLRTQNPPYTSGSHDIILSYDQSDRASKESREKGKRKRQKLGTVRLRRYLFPVRNATILSEFGFSDLKMTLVYEDGFIFCGNLCH